MASCSDKSPRVANSAITRSARLLSRDCILLGDPSSIGSPNRIDLPVVSDKTCGLPQRLDSRHQVSQHLLLPALEVYGINWEMQYDLLDRSLCGL